MASSVFVGNTRLIGITLERRTDGKDTAVGAYCDGSHIGDTEAWSAVLEGHVVESGCVEDEEGPAYFQRHHDSARAERWGIYEA